MVSEPGSWLPTSENHFNFFKGKSGVGDMSIFIFS